MNPPPPPPAATLVQRVSEHPVRAASDGSSLSLGMKSSVITQQICHLSVPRTTQPEIGGGEEGERGGGGGFVRGSWLQNLEKLTEHVMTMHSIYS